MRRRHAKPSRRSRASLTATCSGKATRVDVARVFAAEDLSLPASPTTQGTLPNLRRFGAAAGERRLARSRSQCHGKGIGNQSKIGPPKRATGIVELTSTCENPTKLRG